MIPCRKTPPLLFFKDGADTEKGGNGNYTWHLVASVAPGATSGTVGKKVGTQPLGTRGEPLTLDSRGLGPGGQSLIWGLPWLLPPRVAHGGPVYTKVISPDTTEPNC